MLFCFTFVMWMEVLKHQKLPCVLKLHRSALVMQVLALAAYAMQIMTVGTTELLAFGINWGDFYSERVPKLNIKIMRLTKR